MQANHLWFVIAGQLKMIFTESKEYSQITEQLDKEQAMAIVSCDKCAKKCRTGGEKGMQKLAGQLKKDGYGVAEQILIEGVCTEENVSREKITAQQIITLSCEAGAYILKKLHQDRKIIDALQTKSLAACNENEIFPVKEFKD